MLDIKIIVATHKKYNMPTENIYFPLQVGTEDKEDLGLNKDNEGDNISCKNSFFSELTGLYWAWKNINAEYIGLTHYRRHFTCNKKVPKNEKDKFKILLKRDQLEELLKNNDIILPKKRNYYIETLYNHYKHTTYIEPLDETRKIITEQCPNYLPEFDKLYTRKSAHMFNMFIMKNEYLDQYCEWLFKILFELEKRIDPNKYDSFHGRYLGRISELLLDIWINTNKLDYKEIKVVEIENINWLKKIVAFLQAKFIGKKYKKSFN